MRRAFRLLVPLLSLAVGAGAVAVQGGCSPTKPPREPTVCGRLTFQGRPVAGGTVVFTPDPDHGAAGKPLRAATAADGTFTLRAGDGPVPPGWYRVALATPSGEATDPPFPSQLRRPDRSGLVREVAAGKDHVFEFAVEVPPAGASAAVAP